ncbi:MAG TPA: TonB-dependent receptor [Bacteroidales bacterium]|nr:TonB-dependent receptor [Bacteroidales bacterium]
MKRLMTLLLAVALFSLTSAYAQYEVRGTVVDTDGLTVIGATVLQQGTSNGTTTDLDGRFTLRVPSGETLLEVSYMGYKTLVIEARNAARVVLYEDTELLEEVVIIGYGTVKKSDMTGSVVAIKAEDLNRGAISSPDQMLLGKVSGLHITPATGQPGASAKIRIRGAASLNASNDPLIVIDGVPITGDGGAGMGNPLSSVNPNDIESYTVLKDASATAIYGSRASNGVIIITTKKGAGKKLNVGYNASYSLKQNASTIEMMSADEYRDFMNTTYLGNQVIHNLLGTENTDWQQEIYRLSFNTDQNVSVYGALPFMPYRVSLGYNLDQATLKTGDNQRGNIDISLSPKLFDDHLTIHVNAKGIYQKTNWASTGAVGNALAFDPTKPVYFTKEDGSIDTSKANGYWNWLNTDGSANTMASTNPLSSIYDYTNFNNTLRSIGNMQLVYKVHGLEDLTLNVNAGYDVARTQGEKYNALGSISAMRSSNDLYVMYENYNKNTLLETYLNYNHAFRRSHLDIMAGYSWQHNYVQYDEEQYRNTQPDGPGAHYFTAPTNAKEYYLISFFGRINYSIASRYLFTVTLRDDASSRFSKANRWGLFPSAAFAWNVAEENFLKGSRSVSALKLRLGWGRTGQQDIGSDYYPYLARYLSSSSPEMLYLMGSGYLTTLAPLAYNANLKWETTETYNVGLDFGFANDRITGSVETYYRYTYDLLNVISTPLGSNFGNSIISNIGNMENKGVELSLNFIPVQTSDMHWSIGGNLTLQNTKITKLTSLKTEGYLGVTTGEGMGGTGGYTSLHREGFTPYTFYMFQQLYDQEGNPVQNGLIDRDGDGEITDADRYVTGYSPAPDAFFGFNTQFRYKNWDLGINGHGSLGNYLINGVAMGYSTSYSDDWNKGYLNNLSKQYLVKGWTAPSENNQKYSDMFIENASFFRIDDINLGYTINKLKCIKSLRIAASVQNVYVFTKYRGLDPEIGSSDGVDFNIIPRPRLFTLRLNLTF